MAGPHRVLASREQSPDCHVSVTDRRDEEWRMETVPRFTGDERTDRPHSPSTNVRMHCPPSIVHLSGQSTSVETTAVGLRKNPDDDKSN
ncbi:unnamed protein product [Aspergillus oryzae]|nr:unnamed protein product [Aspergillus oryzae]GMF88156.1 unnamed protein product [Aspergillus oryzae]